MVELRWRWRDDCFVRLSRHASQALLARGFGRAELRGLLARAEVVEYYEPLGYPYPNYLLLTWDLTQPIHIVVADILEQNEVIVVTAYEPDPELWLPDWKTRRRR